MPVAQAPVQHVSVPLDRVEKAIYRAINRARRRFGLRHLRLAGPLSEAAQSHSRDLAVHHLLSHSSSDGTPFYTRIRRADHTRVVGETLLTCTGGSSAKKVVRAWMHSPPHRAELLGRPYRAMGIGRATVHGRSFITADFAG
jgi:uncharacterized protein YkwD